MSIEHGPANRHRSARAIVAPAEPRRSHIAGAMLVVLSASSCGGIAAAATNVTATRSSVGDRLVEILAVDAGDQSIGMQQDEGSLRIAAGRHLITVTKDGAVRVDGVVRAPVVSGTIRITIRGSHIDVGSSD